MKEKWLSIFRRDTDPLVISLEEFSCRINSKTVSITDKKVTGKIRIKVPIEDVESVFVSTD